MAKPASPRSTKPRGKRTAQGAPVRATAEPATEGLLTGQFLIAMPSMNTPHFSQAVIYVCAHTPDGAMGIVLNRPLASPSFGDLLQQLDVTPSPPARQIDLFRGGPVDSARGFVPAYG